MIGRWRRPPILLLLASVLVLACTSASDPTARPTASPAASPPAVTPSPTARPTPTPTPTPPPTPTATTRSTVAPASPQAASPTARATLGATGFPVQPDGVAWPTDEWVEAGLPASVDKALIDAASERAFNDGLGSRVRAVVIVHGGAIVYERYSPNPADGPDVVMPSYSVAKSVTSAMIGILVRDGRLAIDEPAPVPEWHQDRDDPRAEITVEHMLHMATGMTWTDGTDPLTDMFRMFTSSDMAAYAADQVLTYGPGSRFDYNTGTSTLLARIVGEAAGGGPQQTRDFLEAELFDPIGMKPVETAFDDVGTWAGGFSADSTARGFARFGLLYARGGTWDGRQILPAQWVEYTRAPSPANPEYGAHWWLDTERPGVTYALGLHGQVITVDPAHDLVIIQLSTIGGELPLTHTEAILDAFAGLD